MSPEQLFEIGMQIRQEVSHLGDLENPTEKAFPPDLETACAVASYRLAKALQEKGLPAVLVQGLFFRPQNDWGLDHCWVEIAGQILDVTATQFNVKEKVLIVPATDPRFRPIHRGDAALKDLTEWPSEQQPWNYYEE